ncbi:hypothetical protein EON68_03195, partial [archaeon]
MPGKPMLLPLWPLLASTPSAQRITASDGGASRDAIVWQSTMRVDMKPNGGIGPYQVKSLVEVSGGALPGSSPSADGGDDAGAGSVSAGSSSLERTKAFFSPAKTAGTAASGAKRTASGMAAAAAEASAAAAAAAAGDHTPTRYTYIVQLTHTSGSQMVTLLQQLWSIQQRCKKQSVGFERTALEAVVAPRRDGPFNLSLLSDFREKPLLPAAPLAFTVERVFPLVTCPGRIMVTEKAVYIQPSALNNISSAEAVTKWTMR